MRFLRSADSIALLQSDPLRESESQIDL